MEQRVLISHKLERKRSPRVTERLVQRDSHLLERRRRKLEPSLRRKEERRERRKRKRVKALTLRVEMRLHRWKNLTEEVNSSDSL